MLLRVASLLFIALLAFGCSQHTINQDEVVSVLKSYGAANPENHIRITTKFGIIELQLYEDTPLHRANFVRLVKNGFFDGEGDFQRVVRGFVVQGGAPGRVQVTHLIPQEMGVGHYHHSGALAAARRDDNPGKASNAADFYIVHGHGTGEDELNAAGISNSDARWPIYRKIGGAPSLDGNYTVFGQVTMGMDVVEKIASQQVADEKPLQKIPFQIAAY